MMLDEDATYTKCQEILKSAAAAKRVLPGILLDRRKPAAGGS